MRMMKFLPVVLVFFATNEIAAQQWSQFRDESEFFAVNFPGEPVITEAPYASEYGATFPSKTYTVEYDDYHYSIKVVDFTDAQQIYLELPDKTDEASSQWLWLYDQFGAIAQAARHFRERGGTVTFDAWNHIDFVEGHQLQITNPDGSRTFAGLYLHNSRLYILEATVPEGALPPGLFQQSITFLDDTGTRVRYELNPERERVSVRRIPEESTVQAAPAEPLR
ncbi:MAG TPA: hypothetical protein VIV14_01215 [Gammaproteobacteria bacterium]